MPTSTLPDFGSKGELKGVPLGAEGVKSVPFVEGLVFERLAVMRIAVFWWRK